MNERGGDGYGQTSDTPIVGSRELAQFPLTSAVLPTMRLPLKVFEPRYRSLMTDIMAGDRLFGTSLISRGPEVGGGDVRTDVGTVVEVVDATELSDGQWFLEGRGVQRYRVESWLDDDPYPRAIVSPWPDEPADAESGGHGDEPGEQKARRATAVLREEVNAGFRLVLVLASELGFPSHDVVLDDDPERSLYQMAALLPLSPYDSHRVLAAPGYRHRLEVMNELTADAAELLRFRLSER